MKFSEGETILKTYESIILMNIPFSDASPIAEQRFACGSFGCVYPTNREEVVFKITEDIEEARVVDLIIETKNSLHGFVRYYKIIQLEERLFALWREEVYDMGSFSRMKPAVLLINRMEYISHHLRGAWLGQPQSVIKKSMDHITWAMETFSEYHKLPSRGLNYLTKEQAVAVLLNYYRLTCEEMMRVPEIRLIGESMIDLMQRKIIMMDIRTQNIGIVRRNDEDVLVIADPSVPVFYG